MGSKSITLIELGDLTPTMYSHVAMLVLGVCCWAISHSSGLTTLVCQKQSVLLWRPFVVWNKNHSLQNQTPTGHPNVQLVSISSESFCFEAPNKKYLFKRMEKILVDTDFPSSTHHVFTTCTPTTSILFHR